jgi:putative RecB family exonuclease
MSLPKPASLTPSKVTSFRECAFAFRLSVIDKIPQPTNIWTLRGSLAHRVLDRFYYEVPQGQRTRAQAQAIFDEVWSDFISRSEFLDLLRGLSERDLSTLRSSSWKMVDNDFRVENPNEVRVLGTEIMMETVHQDIVLRGVIDRLDLNSDGSLTVTDYKTGRIPSELKEHEKLIGVHFYALLCEAVLKKRPSSVQLIYLKDALTIVAHPTEASIRSLQTKTSAIWRAVEHACDRDDFRPRPSKLCSYCSYQTLCPAQRGSLTETSSGERAQSFNEYREPNV